MTNVKPRRGGVGGAEAATKHKLGFLCFRCPLAMDIACATVAVLRAILIDMVVTDASARFWSGEEPHAFPLYGIQLKFAQLLSTIGPNVIEGENVDHAMNLRTNG